VLLGTTWGTWEHTGNLVITFWEQTKKQETTLNPPNPKMNVEQVSILP